jgi:hypothetical protein
MFICSKIFLFTDGNYSDAHRRPKEGSGNGSECKHRSTYSSSSAGPATGWAYLYAAECGATNQASHGNAT